MNKIIILATLFFLTTGAKFSSVSSSPVGINVRVTQNSWPQNEPMVAINPLDHNKLVCGYNDQRTGDYWAGWSWSDDGGTTWTFGDTFSFLGYNRGCDPVVAFDNTGTAYFSGLVYNYDPHPDSLGKDGSIFIAKSNDGGHTFNVFQKIVATGSGRTNYLDKPWLYVNPFNNDVYLAWVKRVNAWGVEGTESATIWFTRSNDGGVTFSPPVQVSTFSPATGTDRSHGPQITAISANHIYVSWHTIEAGNLPDPPTFPWRIWISESIDGGITFGTNNLVVTSVWGYPNRFISMDSDPSSGRIYIAYADSTIQSPRDYDIFITSSLSAAGPWTAPKKVNDDIIAGRWQFWPSLDVATNARVDMIWYDYRNDPNKLNVYFSSSWDGGATWKANLKITDLVSGFTPVSDFAGDYITVASVDEKAIAVWMDNRLGNQEIYTTTITQSPGIVLLFDTSGSMSWSHEGDRSVPPEEQRLTLAKRATIPFLEMLNDHYEGHTYLGISTFPFHPWDSSVGCIGQVVTPLTLADSVFINSAKSTTIPNLIAEGNTPLLAGISTAMGMFGNQLKPVIILLSDGYHNCPSTVYPSDTQVLNLINQLDSKSIRVYTIGFARPADIDEPLLKTFASQTGGIFYDVTKPGFDPYNWDPGIALQTTYKAILIDWLDLQPIADPFGSISAGEKVTHEVYLNEHDQKVSFFLSWATPNAGKLDLKVQSSDGQPVPVIGEGVIFHQGETHMIITVGKEFLEKPDKVGPTPWKIQIDGGNLTEENMKYQYSVFSDSFLRLKPSIQIPSLKTGAKISVSAEITEAGKPITNLTNVNVKVIHPDEGLGNWFVKHNVSIHELKKIPEKIGEEIFSNRYRKTVYLTDERNVDLPVYTDADILQLFDDGTHGDVKADDGIYTNTYTDTIMEGTYSFHFYATGSTLGGNIFERETEIHKYLTPKFSPEHSDLRVVTIYSDNKIQRVEILVTPKDTIGNYLGPGYADGMNVNVTWGQAITELQDNLDGSYSQIFELPTSVASNAEITVDLEDKTKSVTWAEAPGPELFNWLTWVLIIFIILLLIFIAVTRFRNR